MSGSFSFLPFVALIEAVPSAEEGVLYSAIARIAPFLIPSDLVQATQKILPATAEYYALLDHSATHDDVYKILDAGATKVVSPDVSLVGVVPSDRLVLRINSTTATVLNDPAVLEGISAVLLDTPSFAENLLKSYRTALNLAKGRPRDFFILANSRDEDVIRHQPASLKLMTRTVGGTSILPVQFLSLSLGNHNSPQPLDSGKLSITTLFTSALRTDRLDGLFPTIPVSLSSVPTTLGLVYSSNASISSSITSGNAVYYSRSRSGLWRKGETSGAMQIVQRIRIDCDADALEFGVVETGPNGAKDGFCHVPDQTSCFGPHAGLAELEATLRSRAKDAPKGSYTARLFAEPKLLRAKIMEEAAELCDAQSTEDVAAEAADLLYFALVKCVGAGIGLREIAGVLDLRSRKVTRRKGDAKKEWADKLGLEAGQAVGVAGGVGAAATAGAVEAKKEVSPPPPTADIRCQTFDLAAVSPSERAALLKRPIQSSSDIIARVTPIIDTVRSQGDAGLRSLVVQFDRCTPLSDPTAPLVLSAPFAPSSMVLTPTVKAAIDQAYSNIRKFHGAQMEQESKGLVVETMPGVSCSRFARPIEHVGIYVPGGTAILPSTALMLAVPAQVAKCSTITLATPPRPDGSISPEIVYIASITGVNTIVRAGGAQAVAAMAYGTESVPKVDKIFGPGNQVRSPCPLFIQLGES